MIERIVEASARNKFVVLILTAVAVAIALWSLRNVPLDAIPDLSDTQVIVYSRWDRSPDVMEDQVHYPIISSLLGAPKVKAIRGFSDFGFCTSTSSSRMGPTCTGPAVGPSNTSARSNPACRKGCGQSSAPTRPGSAGFTSTL